VLQKIARHAEQAPGVSTFFSFPAILSFAWGR